MNPSVDPEDCKGMIFNVQRFSLHDGAGIRTMVFMKGCPMSCAWCANPESQKPGEEIFLHKSNCIGCGTCIRFCPNHALSLDQEGLKIERNLCALCKTCIGVCNTGAITLVGREVTVKELFSEVAEDRLFFETSGGGVTFSGGEPFYQPEFLGAILQKCKNRDLHTVVETCGLADQRTIKDLMPLIDCVYYDLKIMNPEKHKAYTGADNEIILTNLRILAESGKQLLVRTPIVPGITSGKKNISSIGAFLQSIGIKTMQILPYHAYGTGKYTSIGRSYLLKTEPPTGRRLAEIVNELAQYGVSAFV